MTRSPFKFLDAYDRTDSRAFFGRERETAQLFNAVHASNLVVVYGGSGTGKTSLIQCGLGNQFEDSDWLPLFVRRGIDLNRSLDVAIERALPKTADLGAQVAERIRSVYLEHYRPVYLIFDQFEELFIIGTPQEQRLFYDTVREILDAGLPCKMLVVLREEYIAYLSDFEKTVPSLLDNRLRIEKMRDHNLARVIAGTAQVGGVDLVEPKKTVKKILENIRDRRTGVDLAYLQVYLDRVWRAELDRQGNESPQRMTFDPALVDQVGKLGDVISDFIDEQMAVVEGGLRDRGLAKPDGIPLWILGTLVTAEGTKRPLEEASMREDLPNDVQVGEEYFRYCLEEFARLRLVRELA